MNVLVITQMFPCKRHPTSAIFFANLMRELAARVDTLLVVTPRVYFPKGLTKIKPSLKKWLVDEMHSADHGLEIFRPFVLSVPFVACAGLNAIFMHRSLRKVLQPVVEKRGIDLILGYNMIPEGIAAVRLAREFKLRVGFWVIGSDLHEIARANRLNYSLCKKAIAESDVVFAESKDLEYKIKSISKRPSKVRTFYKGIAVANFQNLPAKNFVIRKLNLSLQKRYLLFVGRLLRSKGVYELADAFIEVARRYPDFDLILIGEESEKAGLLAKFAGANLLQRVYFKGIIPYTKIAEFMKAGELLVFPSWDEGLPNVVMEAMAIGLPVVASRVGGTPEILRDEITGLSVPPKNSAALVDAIVRMIEDKTLREQCVRNAQRLVLEKFDVKKNVEVLSGFLRQMISHSVKVYSDVG